MNKKIIASLATIAVVTAAGIGGTIAYFSDVEKSSGNVIVTGNIDLTVDHAKQTYNGEECVGNCNATGGELIQNGGFETPDVATGNYKIYTESDFGTTKWHVESGAGLEIQDNVAGTPYEGQQYAELDSDNSSVISQTIATAAAKKYRLTFWYSPRLNNGTDNTVGIKVLVAGDSGAIVNDSINETSVTSNNWTKATYDFIATDSDTKIKFSDLGNSNSLGGYLDDISVKELKCDESHFATGGTCALWNARNLAVGDTFWSFRDVKPGDFGTNVISLHVFNNPAWACMSVNPTAGSSTIIGNGINVKLWRDADCDGAWDSGEVNLLGTVAQIPLAQLVNQKLYDHTDDVQLLPDTDNQCVAINWCAGTFNGGVCDPSVMGNNAQDQTYGADVVLEAIQTRHNTDFVCASSTIAISDLNEQE